MTMLFEWLISNAITATILALIALAVSKAWPRRPALAHACWLLVLVKLLTPPIYVFPLTLPASVQVAQTKPKEVEPNIPLPSTSVPSHDLQAEQELWTQFVLENPSVLESQTLPDPLPDAANVPSELASTTVPPSQPAPIISWTLWLCDLWQTWGDYGVLALQVLALLGTGYLILLTLGRVFRFERLLRLAQPAGLELQETTRQMGSALGLKQSPSVLIVPGKVGPLLWHRWTEPVIVLPSGLLENMNGQELQTVLAHELTHYRRGDHLWRYLELAAVACYWWLPSAWWASRRLRQAEEECCDAGVVASLPDGVASYASALVRSLTYVAEPTSPCPALSSGLGPVTLLKRRLTMLQTKVERRLGVRSWLLLAAVAALALPIGISLADDDAPPLPRRSADRQGDARPRTPALPPSVERDDDDPVTPPTAPRASAAPRTPSPVRTPSAPGQVPFAGALPPQTAFAPTSPVAPTGSYPVQGGMPPMAPSGVIYGSMGQGGGFDDQRVAAEDAVRTAELDLKLRRNKVRAAESAIRVYERETKRNAQLYKNGSISDTDVSLSEARLDQAKTDLEAAQIGVEQGELAIEQAKRRLSNFSRRSQSTMPSMTPSPGMPPSGNLPPVGAPPGKGDGRLPPLGMGGSGGGISGGMAAGGGPALTDERLKTMFDNMDKDKTGRLTKDQFTPLWRERFDEFDKNHDGVVTFDEFKGSRDKLMQRMGGGVISGGGFGGQMGGPGGPGGLGGSGQAGGLSTGGGPAGGFGGGVGGGFGGGVARGGPGAGFPGGAPPADPFFRNFDKQNTGKIRKEDVPEWMRERFFEMLDTNHDGVVDHDEFTANYSKLWETPSSRRGAASATSRGRSEGAGRGEGTGRGEASARPGGGGRGEGVGGGEAGGRPSPGRGEGDARPGFRDPRDERMQQLEKELNDLRKTLDDLKRKDRSGGAKP